MTQVRYILADITDETLADTEAFEELCRKLDPGNLMRVLAISAHELFHRYPGKTSAELAEALREGIDDVHDLGLP